jgi:hypothetical protein
VRSAVVNLDLVYEIDVPEPWGALRVATVGAQVGAP